MAPQLVSWDEFFREIRWPATIAVILLVIVAVAYRWIAGRPAKTLPGFGLLLLVVALAGIVAAGLPHVVLGVVPS